jgi:hypothetical protein
MDQPKILLVWFLALSKNFGQHYDKFPKFSEKHPFGRTHYSQFTILMARATNAANGLALCTNESPSPAITHPIIGDEHSPS